jgi:hypothetical protein
MYKYSYCLSKKQIEEIKTISVLAEIYIKRDDNLSNENKNELLETNLKLYKMFESVGNDIEAVSIDLNEYSKQDIEQIQALENKIK